MRLLYVIGVPGAGKTSTVAAAFDRLGWTRFPVEDTPVPHEMLVEHDIVVGAHLGKARDTFGGTDALSMSIAPKARTWVRNQADAGVYPLVVGEGDRLGTGSFLEAVAAMPRVDLNVVLLGCKEEVAAGRRARRGTNQNPSWVSGRVTKVRNLAPYAKYVLDGNRPLEAVAAEFAGLLVRDVSGDPVAR